MIAITMGNKAREGNKDCWGDILGSWWCYLCIGSHKYLSEEIFEWRLE